MPQFEFETFPGQIFWLIVCFTVMYWCVKHIILPQFIAVVDHRENTMMANIQMAKESQKQIDTLEAEIRQKKTKSLSGYQHLPASSAWRS